MDRGGVRLAYLILAHRLPRQLLWLLEAIYDPRDIFLIHVDLKSLLGLKAHRQGVWQAARRFAEGRPNVRLMRPRLTNWGGWSLTRLQLDAISELLDADPDWTHFINISGQCYPIRPLSEIRAAVADAGEQVFVEMEPFSLDSPEEPGWHERWMIELPHRAIKLPWKRRSPTSFRLAHKGSQWCILPRAFCEWQRHAPVRRRITRFLRHGMISDELIFQALVDNGPYRERVAPHPAWEVVFPGPKVMTEADLPMLRASPAFFARKFDENVDRAVLVALSQRIGARALPPSAVAAAEAAEIAVREPERQGTA